MQFRTQAESEFETRLELNFELFQGVSIQLPDEDTAEERAMQLASLPSVKNIWPVTIIDRPEPEMIESLESTLETASAMEHFLRKRFSRFQERQVNGSALADSPIKMTQIDKLHDRSITGEGITIAVIDTGVSSLGLFFGLNVHGPDR